MMDKKYISTLLVFCISLFFCAYHAVSEDNSNEIYISKIKIKNAGEITKKQIQQNIATQFPSVLPWKKKPVFDEEVFKQDIIRIINLYKENGFYDVKVDYELEEGGGKKVEILIDIQRGQQIVLQKLGLTIDPIMGQEEKNELLDIILLKEDDFFSAKDYQRSKNIIKNYFSNRGYPLAKIEAEALVNRGEKWAKVNISVNTGNKYRFGRQTVEGNINIRENIIRRELLYKTGDDYSTEKLDRTRIGIFGLGYFRSVVIDTKFNETESVVDTIVKVEEKKLGSVKLGIGYGTEDLLRGQMIWNQRNFFGGGRDLEVSGKFSFLTQRLSAKLLQPYLFGRDIDYISTLATNRDDFPSYTSESLLFSNKIEKQIYNNINLSSSFNLQLSRLSDISGSTVDFVESDEYLLTFFNIGLDRSTVDNVLNPKNGTSLSFNLESSLSFLGSDENFIKGVFEFKGYKEMKGVVFAKRLDVGIIQPFSDTSTLEVPIFKRFFTGGSTTMRGFPFQELGPLDTNGDPVGGNTLLLGNLEARYPIYKKLGGVVFFDYGNVFADEYDFKLDDIKYAIGTGLRFNTIIGPLRVDFGYTLNPEPNIDRFQFFLSIGHAF
jgi:outer membrane protein assembly complex protein YaeT